MATYVAGVRSRPTMSPTLSMLFLSFCGIDGSGAISNFRLHRLSRMPLPQTSIFIANDTPSEISIVRAVVVAIPLHNLTRRIAQNIHNDPHFSSPLMGWEGVHFAFSLALLIRPYSFQYPGRWRSPLRVSLRFTSLIHPSSGW